MSRAIDNNYIQFHFNVKGHSKFLFNNNSYELPLAEENSLLLYNPQRDLPLNVTLAAESWLVSLVISIKKIPFAVLSGSRLYYFFERGK